MSLRQCYWYIDANVCVFIKVDVVDDTRVEDIVDRYFREVDENFRLEVLYPKSINELCRRLVEYDDDDAAENIIK